MTFLLFLSVHHSICNYLYTSLTLIALMLKLHRLLEIAFILSRSLAWYFCLKSDYDKLEKLNQRTLRSFFQNKENNYRYLLKAGKTPLYHHRLQNIAILIYKALNNIALYLFLWSWVGGILRIPQSDWFRERAVFSYVLTTVMVTNYAKRRVKLQIERAKFQFVLIIFCNRAVLLFNCLIKKTSGFWRKLSQRCHLLTRWWDNV